MAHSSSHPEMESGDSDTGDEEDNLSDSDDNQSIEDEEAKRTAIRKELSDLSFEELEALKQKIGTKEWNEAMFGSSSSSTKSSTKKKNKKHSAIPRGNKNRPREISAKARVPKIREVIPVQKKKVRDPRFENLCGDLDEKVWSKNYSFLNEIRKGEQEELKKRLDTEEDETKRAEIKHTLQKFKNKERSDAVKKEQEDKRRAERDENLKRMREGKNPYYVKKSTRKYLDLAEKYDQLKAAGKLDNYLKKKRQKNAVRDKKQLKLPKAS